MTEAGISASSFDSETGLSAVIFKDTDGYTMLMLGRCMPRCQRQRCSVDRSDKEQMHDSRRVVSNETVLPMIAAS